MSTATQTGMPIIDCAKCDARHPRGRSHCVRCASASLFLDGGMTCLMCRGVSRNS